MAEREYFSLRYAVPGYIFILLVIGFNIGPLFSMLVSAKETASIFSGFLALFSGSAIGFLVSQLWWRWFHWRLGLYKWKPVTSLIKKYKLTDDPEDKRKVLFVYDFVLHSNLHSKPELKGVSNYCARRWDMYILLSCVSTSLILGTVIGMASRIVYEWFIGKTLLSELQKNFWFFLNVGEFWILAFALITAIVMLLLVAKERKWNKREYEDMHDIFIDKFAIAPEELRKIFPSEFFK